MVAGKLSEAWKVTSACTLSSLDHNSAVGDDAFFLARVRMVEAMQTQSRTNYNPGQVIRHSTRSETMAHLLHPLEAM